MMSKDIAVVAVVVAVVVAIVSHLFHRWFVVNKPTHHRIALEYHGLLFVMGCPMGTVTNEESSKATVPSNLWHDNLVVVIKVVYTPQQMRHHHHGWFYVVSITTAVHKAVGDNSHFTVVILNWF